MRRASFIQALIVGTMTLSLVGCTHVPIKIKSASARQAEMLSAFERSLAEQDLAKGCNESFKASIEMEEIVKRRGGEIQERIRKNFTDAMVRAYAFKEKSPELAAKKEAEAMQTLIEQTTQLQSDIANLRAEIELERGKCAEAVASIRDMVHSLAAAQTELDKFIQSDAKRPIETFLFNLVETKTIARKVDEKTKELQSKMGGVAEKLKAWEGAFNAIKE
ncbi:MAG: hypothetical protein A3G41_08055 [Elusimicrobia bacterium RIFCSPLOWO2_12_FULL_59_9]|nr:MAG: hypothetical protein A3G41_08055 [Elusimicrobia bacterium RIFCSPLOWO2_12_FULL_59_9]